MEHMQPNPKEVANITRFLDSLSDEYMFSLSWEMRLQCLAILTENPDTPFEVVRSMATRELKPDALVFDASA